MTRLGDFLSLGPLFSSGIFMKNTISILKFGSPFFHGKSYVLIWKKIGFGHILGDFLTNSSGHPASKADRRFRLSLQIFRTGRVRGLRINLKIRFFLPFVQAEGEQGCQMVFSNLKSQLG
jgi:hypothetical protein